MQILSSSGVRVYVYDEDHAPPHCHVVMADGTELSVELPLLKEMYGKKLKKNVRKFLEENLDFIADEWEKRNPKKHNN